MAQPTVDAYTAALPLHQREVVQALREIVRLTAPQATESIKWAQPVYDDNGPFAYIKASKGHVTFGFWRGVEIDAGRNLLASSGSKMAHLKLRTVADVKPGELTPLIKKAVQLNRRLGDPSRPR